MIVNKKKHVQQILHAKKRRDKIKAKGKNRKMGRVKGKAGQKKTMIFQEESITFEEEVKLCCEATGGEEAERNDA